MHLRLHKLGCRERRLAHVFQAGAQAQVGWRADRRRRRERECQATARPSPRLALPELSLQVLNARLLLSELLLRGEQA